MSNVFTSRTVARGVFLALVLLVRAQAQVTLGSITGVVQDSTKAVVPGVTVVATNEATGIKSQGITQADGVYLIRQLTVGTYSISCSAQGFKPLTMQGLQVETGTTLTQDLRLEVGQVTENINVTAQSSLVQTTSGDVATTISVQQVLEIPLASRNVFSLMNLVPTARLLSLGGDSPQNPYSGVSLGGSRNLQTVPMLDGVLNAPGPVGNQTFNMSPPVDAMQEFKVQVNNLSAEYGRTLGGVVNAATRSGTNQFHGTLYEYWRNDAFDALGWGNDSKPKVRRNQFGATVGGPIIKNKTFFFYNYDALRNNTAGSSTQNVGLPAWWKGDFSTATRQVGNSAVMVPIYDPATGSGTFEAPRGTLPFSENKIPTSRLDPVAAHAAGLAPAPNRVPNNPYNQSGNWQLNTVPKYTTDFHIMRIDHEFTSRTKMYGRYMFSPGSDGTDGLAGWGLLSPGSKSQNRGQNLALSATHLFSPTFVVNVNVGLHRYRNNSVAANCCEENRGAEFGIKGLFEGRGENVPQFNFGGGGLVPLSNIGGGGNRRLVFNNTSYAANFTRIHGSHTLLFGGDHSEHWARIIIRLTDSGNWQFDGHFTRGVNENGSFVASTGLPLADFLLGRVNSVDATIQPVTTRKLMNYAAYIQDDWRVTRNLTLNLGLRWETQTPDYELGGKRSNFNPFLVNPLAGTGDIPAGALGQFEFQDRNGRGKYLFPWHKANFAPRFGFAYRLRGSNETVLRGGYGIFFGDMNPGGGVEWGRYGFAAAAAFSNPVPFRLQDGFPQGGFVIPAESDLTPGFASRGTKFALAAFDFTNPYQNMEYTQNLNVTFQHQHWGTLFEVGYLGNLARHIPENNLNMNQIPAPLLSRTDIPERLRRPYTAYASDQANVRIWQNNICVANYHALTVKMERRSRNGVSFIGAYTFSRYMDNTAWGNVGGVQPALQDLSNRLYTLAGGHSPHRLVVSPIVELPFGKGRRLLDRGGVVNAVLGGWEVSAIGTMQSGYPLTATVLNGARDIKGDGAAGAVLWPNVVGDANSPDKGQPAVGVRGLQWLTESAFAVPAKYTMGNLRRVIPDVLSPGMISFDSMLAKNFRFAERWRAQLRWETFNTFNTPQWGSPGTNVGQGNFGVITGASGRRTMQFGMKLYW